MKSSIYRTLLLAVLMLVPAVPVSSSPRTVNYHSLINNLCDVGSLAVCDGSRVVQFSSWDRSGGNIDRGHFLSGDGKKAAVLADVKGSGAMVRFWSANPSGVICIYLDGKSDPIIKCSMRDYFLRRMPQPIAGRSSGGYISYEPVPFSKSCRVVVYGAGYLYYQINMRIYPAGTKVRPYRAGDIHRYSRIINKAASVWRGERSVSQNGYLRLGAEGRREWRRRTFVAPAGGKAVIFNVSGAGCIEKLSLTVKRGSLDKCMLRAYWDKQGKPAVFVPALSLFGAAGSKENAKSLLTSAEGTDYAARFAMPFARYARVEIVNYDSSPLAVRVDVTSFRFSKLAGGVGRFCASFRMAATKPGVPFEALNIRGKGRLIGLVLASHADRSSKWLEGDECIFIDGEKLPSIRGTGTEDYFNCGWMFKDGLLSRALYGVTSLDLAHSQFSAYRWHVPDPISFNRSLLVRFEHGERNTSPGITYSAAAFYYLLD